jgi:hypothetical protein
MECTKSRRPLTDAEREKARVVARWLIDENGYQPQDAAPTVALYSFAKLKAVYKAITGKGTQIRH